MCPGQYSLLLFLIPVSVKLLRCSAKLWEKNAIDRHIHFHTSLFFQIKKIAVDDS